jgi:S1-C subfamily serine protease
MGYAKTVDQVKPVRGATLQGRFDIGRYTLDRPTIRFVDLARGIGSLGSSVLGQFVVTIDPANARLRLAGPAEGQLRELAERKPHYGLQFEALEANPIRVAVVDAGSPAGNGGILPKDEIVRMNGRALESVSLDERLEALRNSPLGLTVRRNGNERVVNLTLK